jgi:hypothetical protein
MKAQNYLTLAESAPADLDKQVNSYLAKGYELYGSPYTTGDGDDYPFLFVQAVVRYGSPTEAPATAT